MTVSTPAAPAAAAPTARAVAVDGNPSVLGRFEQVMGVSAAQLTAEQVRAEMRLVRSVQAMVTARMLQLSQRLTELSRSPGSPFVTLDPVREIRTHAGLRPREIRTLDTQTTAVAAAPQLGALLASGATTGAHVEAVGRTLGAAGPGRDTLVAQIPSIVERAVTMRVDDFDRYLSALARDAQPDDGLTVFEQQRRSTHLRIWNTPDGMTRITGAFDPERGTALRTALDRHTDTLFRNNGPDNGDVALHVAPGIDPNDHRRAIALHHLCTRTTGRSGGADSVGSSDGRPPRAEVIVHVDLHTLRSGLHPQSTSRTVHGTDLPPDTIRRLACDADIIPVVLSGHRVPLDVGRAKRLATIHQRRALEALHTTCAVPDCTVAYTHCTIHHLTPWEHGGPTDLDNLVPLCSRHHHAAHEGGWTLTLHPATRHLSVAHPSPAGDRSGGHRRSHDPRHPPDPP